MVSGYLRRAIPITNVIPNDIKNIICKFYSCLIKWIIKGDDIKRFSNYTRYDCVHGPKIKVVDGIVFELRLYPKDWSSYVSFSVGICENKEHRYCFDYKALIYLRELNFSERIDKETGGRTHISLHELEKLNVMTIECDVDISIFDVKK